MKQSPIHHPRPILGQHPPRIVDAVAARHRVVHRPDKFYLLDEAAVAAVSWPWSAPDHCLLLVAAEPDVVLDGVFAHGLYARVSRHRRPSIDGESANTYVIFLNCKKVSQA